jgi:hypothetical protein
MRNIKKRERGTDQRAVFLARASGWCGTREMAFETKPSFPITVRVENAHSSGLFFLGGGIK